jgi:ribosomal protein S18 acetylase RimI-like enzyme
MTPGGNGVTIRPDGPLDLDFIQSLSKQVFSQYGPYDRILADWFQSGKTLTRLALIDDRPVGFAMVRRPEDDDPFGSQHIGELLAIAVEPQRQGLGVGDLLMIEILRVAQEVGITTLILCSATTNEPGKALFKKHGFETLRVKKGYYPSGQESMMMYRMIP